MKKIFTLLERKNKEKNLLENIILFIIKNFVHLSSVIVYFVYLIIFNFDNLIIKLFKKLQRPVRVTIIYTMAIISIINVFDFYNYRNFQIRKIVTTEQKVQVAIVDKEVAEEPKEEPKKEKTKCSLNEIECKIYDRAIELGMTHDQALITLSISKHETGKWTSNAFKNKNNFGGVMKNGSLAIYKTQEEGLDAFITLLKNYYFGQGRTTIEKIGEKYCPVGASNDPKGINKNWIPKVTRYYEQYKEKGVFENAK